MAQGLFTLRQQVQGIIQGAWSGYIAPKTVEYLVVAGGGGGGNGNAGGGGGGGGLLQGTVPVTAGTSYTVTVGSGGAGGAQSLSDNTLVGSVGQNSVFGSISATGGGGGGASGVSSSAGGSGGGSGGSANNQVGGSQGVAGQGNKGGAGNNINYPKSGGGGGAGNIGQNYYYNATGPQFSGNGGIGVASSISGTVTAYGGGGGGGGDYRGTTVTTTTTGGVGGGGAGSLTGVGTSGAANTGGGGGGGGLSLSPTTFYAGGTGGSGIVIVRYPGNVQFYTGGTVNYTNGFITHIFLSSGTLAPTTPTVYSTSYQISRSLRFNSADSAYLTRTPASASNRKTWTWSGWVKLSKLPTVSDVVSNFLFGSGAGDEFYICQRDTGSLNIRQVTSSVEVFVLITTPVYRDLSAYGHIVLAVDTTQATATNRVKLYWNGSQITDFSSTTYPSQNLDTYVNSASSHFIGKRPNGSLYLDSYLTEVNFIDGQQLTPSSFGATSTTTGVWAPIQYTGTYGTNGFYLNFSDNSDTTATTLGKDYSGNTNNWTPNNFSVTAGIGNDSFVDTPTPYGFDTGVGGTVRSNYCTWNPLDTTSTSYISNGNLTNSAAGNNYPIRGTIGVSSGKWYWEWTEASATPDNHIGVWGFSGLTAGTYNYVGEAADSWGIHTLDGNKRNNGSNTAYGSAYANGDVGMCAYDMDAGKIWWGKNGTWFASGSPSAGTNAAFTNLTGTLRPAQIQYTAENFNFGQRAFAYTAPSGFQALCTQNLPTPIIGATSNTLAGQFFNPVLYTGNGTTQSVTGVGFQPDFIWAKSRSNAYYHTLVDSVRTRAYILSTNVTSVEAGPEPADKEFVSFNSDGFSLGPDYNLSVNTSGATFVAWNWKAGNNAGASNSTGSITSTVSVNTRSGFSIVTYTGTGTNATVGHGIGIAPSMVIVKQRNTIRDWIVYSGSLANTQFLVLDTTSGAQTAATFWNSTSPTNTVFSIGTDGALNTSGGTYVAYCFAPVAGYSAFGSYTGNGSADGPFTYTGFRPAYVLIKRTDTTEEWHVHDIARDTYNLASADLYPNTAGAEVTTFNQIDILSNGFKMRSVNTGTNASGGTYIYMAFASNPFKYSIAR